MLAYLASLFFFLLAGKVTKQINLIGRHIADGGGTRVAVYLPNSLEFLATLFGCIFIPHLTAILIPFPVSDDELVSMLKRSAADSVVAASPTSLPLSLARQALPSLRQVIWVDDPATEDEKTEAAPSVSVANWRHIIDQASSPADSELPALDVEHTPHDVVTFGVSGPKEPLEMVSFSQANLIAGIAGQLAALPTHERLRPSDLLLPLDSLASIHTLIITLAALYSNASLALAPASDPTADLGPLVSKLAPTVMVAGPEILLRTREASMAEIRSSTLARLSHRLATRSLTLHGVLPTQGPLPACSSHLRLSSGAGSRRLRLIFVAERAGSRDGHLTPDALTDLRALTGARVIHALAAARVAGALSQTAFYDYQAETAAKRAHFGAPLTSLELYLRDSGPYQTTDEEVQGEVRTYPRRDDQQISLCPKSGKANPLSTDRVPCPSPPFSSPCRPTHMLLSRA